MVASIGPTTSETLEEFGISPGPRADASEDGLSGQRDRRTGAAILDRKRAAACLRTTISGGSSASTWAWLFCCRLCTLIGYVIGYLLDKAFGTHFLTFIFILFGIAAGFIELIRELQYQDDGGK